MPPTARNAPRSILHALSGKLWDYHKSAIAASKLAHAGRRRGERARRNVAVRGEVTASNSIERGNDVHARCKWGSPVRERNATGHRRDPPPWAVAAPSQSEGRGMQRGGASASGAAHGAAGCMKLPIEGCASLPRAHRRPDACIASPRRAHVRGAAARPHLPVLPSAGASAGRLRAAWRAPLSRAP